MLGWITTIASIPLWLLKWLVKGMIMTAKGIWRAWTESRWISNAVQLINVQINRDELLARPQPKLRFNFTGINGAMSAIEYGKVEGRISCDGQELVGEIEVKMSEQLRPKIKSSERFEFSLVQYLAEGVAKTILENPSPASSYNMRFDFRHVRVKFRRCLFKREFDLRLPDAITVNAEKQIWVVRPLLATANYPPPAKANP
jgi:hypothetical protein